MGSSAAEANGRPLVWLRISRMVIGCCGFLSSMWLPSRYTASHWPLNSGRYFSTGSSRFTLPSSTSIISAVAVIGLDCEAIQNSASAAIGLPAATSAYPPLSRARTLILVGHQRDRPGQRVRFTNGCKAAGIVLDAGASWASQAAA